MPTDPPLFSSRLRSLRDGRGLTQEALARAAGLSTRAVVELEGGRRRPLLETATALARALGCTVDAFLREGR